jgi:catechol 2,3-dioxygenase-like lactoylglutathione lyase family enzyme
MTITRIEALTFGVLDLDACIRFFGDLGLEEAEAGATGATFRTPENQLVHLRLADDPGLPASAAAAPTIREVVWGVDTRDAVAAIAAELAKDRTVTAGADGTLHALDNTGFGIGFAVTAPHAADTGSPRRYNVLRTVMTRHDSRSSAAKIPARAPK